MIKLPITKKSQANIIAIILIVLIVLVAISIVWTIIVPLIREKTQEVQFGQFTINLELRDVVLFANGVLMANVHRGSGSENLDGLKFVFYDEQGNSVTRDGAAISELETRTYSFSAITEISEFGKISRVGVAPIINGNLGMVIESEPNSVLEIPSAVVSWWRFDDLNDFVGENTCTAVTGGISNGVLIGKVSCAADLPYLPSGENLAISFWVKGNNNQEIITKGENNNISIENKNLKFHSLANDLLSDEELNENWNHIVISFSDAFLAVYVNKKIKTFSSLSYPYSFESNSNNLIINGEIDDVMFFDRPIANIEGIYSIQNKN